MYILACILFLLPTVLLAAAWRDVAGGRVSDYPEWRKYCVNAALVAATFATLASMLFMFSWLHHGGGPHGLDPSPGLWMRIRPVLKWAFIVGITLTAFGKGRLRLILLGWAPSIVFVLYAVFMLQMD
jgi:hypothetical protein